METSKKEIVIKKANDHWAFLEYIEAPMWADLTLEAKSGGEDTNDDWFSISHLFHQWSSHRLKSKFSHPGTVISEPDYQGPASPELPSSVSRSRGKHYKSKKWGDNSQNILSDKQLPDRDSTRRCFQASSSFGQEVKPKSSFIRSSATFGLVSERKARRNASSNCTKPKAIGRSPVISSSSADNKTSESNSRSTITSEYTQQQHKFKEVSSQPYDQKSLPSFRNTASFRKSCVVKKALSVEIGSDSRQSRGRKSSSGKSSVGSCSNRGYEVKFASKQQREKISDGKDVAIMNFAAKNRCKPSNTFRTSTVQVEEPKFSNRMGRTSDFAKPANHEAAKSLVQHQTVRSRALLPANKQNCSTDATKKLVNGKLNGLAGKRKENAARNVAVHQKSREKGVLAGGLSVDQRTMERNILQKGDIAGSAAFHVQLQGKVTREAKNTINLTRRIYFR